MERQRTRPHTDLVAGVVIILASILLMLRSGTMPVTTALLPFAMLVALIVRALMRDAGPANARPEVFEARNGFFGVCAAIVFTSLRWRSPAFTPRPSS